jgi:hypothetical protein
MSFPLIIVIVLALIVGVVLLLKSRGAAPEPVSKPAQATAQKRLSPQQKRQQLNDTTLAQLKQSKQYWGACIDVENEGNCCEAVLGIQHDPYSFDKLPTLPLPMCDRNVCVCHYIGVKERRSDNRRKGHDRREEVRFDHNASDRRGGKDRRATQDIWMHHDQDT